MSCFWTGEMKIGIIKGVVKTEAGFFEGREITRVWYDSSAHMLSDLVNKTSSIKCADKIFVKKEKDLNLLKSNQSLSIGELKMEAYRPAGESDQKKQIEGTVFMKLDLSDFQLTKVNAFAGRDLKKVLSYLSPRQISLYQKLSGNEK